MDKPSLAIVMATYARPDGSTPSKLCAALASVRAQTWKSWHMYIVGDCYEPLQELVHLVRACFPDQEHAYTILNLVVPGERGKVPATELWQNAGATALNTGRGVALRDGHTWAARLDDDDEWAPDHLEHIVAGIRAFPDSVLVHTQAQYLATPFFPDMPRDRITTAWIGTLAHNVVHSSVALHLHKLRDFPYKCKGQGASDAALWSAIEAAFPDGNSIVHVPVSTVWHLTEAGGARHPKLLRIIEDNVGLGFPDPRLPDGSVAYARYGGCATATSADVGAFVAAWMPKLTAGGVLLFNPLLDKGYCESRRAAAADWTDSDYSVPCPRVTCYDHRRRGFVSVRK